MNNTLEPAIAAEELAPADAPKIRIASVIGALSKALDLSTGQYPGHSVKTCLLGMRIGQEYGYSEAQLQELYYALLLKDCGCSSNASKTFHDLGSDDLKAKRDVKTVDWTKTSFETLQYALGHAAPGKPFLERVRTFLRLAIKGKKQSQAVTRMRCERGASLARLMGLPDVTAEAIRDLDEHWDGSGNPEHKRRAAINLHSRIMLLAQTLENYSTPREKTVAIQEIKRRSKKWFDPDLVKAALSLEKRGELWTDIDTGDVDQLALAIDPEAALLTLGDEKLDSICNAFAQIIDAKSPFTFNHSSGVANAAVAIARKLGLAPHRVIFVRHAALLHDLGKLGISNVILEKPFKLTAEEWTIMKRHPEDTWRILRSIPHFEELAEVAASHHEKLDGSGYFRGLKGDRMPIESRLLVVADIFDAIAAKRPYRDAMPLDIALKTMRKEAPHAIDGDCLRALEESGIASDHTFRDLKTVQEALARYQ